VKRDVVPILAEYEVGDGSKELCKLRAGFAMERGNEKMNEIMAKYHSNDTLNPLPDAPDAAYLYDPIGTMPQRADNE
jgi:hypothetical protein